MICGPKSRVPETRHLYEQTAVKIWLWAEICHCSPGLLFEKATEDVSFKMFTIVLVKMRYNEQVGNFKRTVKEEAEKNKVVTRIEAV